VAAQGLRARSAHSRAELERIAPRRAARSLTMPEFIRLISAHSFRAGSLLFLPTARRDCRKFCEISGEIQIQYRQMSRASWRTGALMLRIKH